MYHIFLSTPLVNNTNYLPHLLEHIVLSCQGDLDKYFLGARTIAENYTYYTSFVLESSSPHDLERLLEYLKSEISMQAYHYEKRVISKELKEQKYFNGLLSRIGQKLYGKSFSYSVSHRASFDLLQAYHRQYYQQGNVLVLEKSLAFQSCSSQGNIFTQSFVLAFHFEHEFVSVAPYSPESLLALSLLESLFDAFLEYHERYINGEYSFNDVLEGEFKDFVFISVDLRYCRLLAEIPSDFLQAFIDQKLDSLSILSPNIDGPLMLKYGFTVSLESKILILRNLGSYYEEWKTWAKSS